ncbi:methionyl-tRNA synthetase [Babesia gibsoni]|uniref:methionine--tRNA ligase n=1 Tax=Babesia gibsoni TaxID=33632 RepID=A0AAD8PE19_BABGI|nr:methionyl-tRNA synthetase [Babesia gibsoni]
MKLLVLDASLESLIAVSAAELYSQDVFALLVSSENRNIEWSSKVEPEEAAANQHIKQTKITVELLEARDAPTVNLFREQLEANGKKLSDSQLEGAISSVLCAASNTTVRPLLLDLDSPECYDFPIFGCNALLKHYVDKLTIYGLNTVVPEKCRTGGCKFDWLSWSSRFRTCCKRFDADAVKSLLDVLEDYLTFYVKISDLPISIGSVVMAMSVTWYTRRIAFMQLNMDALASLKVHMSHVFSAAETNNNLAGLVKYRKLLDKEIDGREPHEQKTKLGQVLKELVGQKFYSTTALAYTNGNPHIGHTYEMVATDVTTRFFGVLGMKTTLMAGTDEHGLKVATTAEKSGMLPIELADYYSSKFRENNKSLQVYPDVFVRTTEEWHKKSLQKLWMKMYEHGDIYLGEYSGWYNVREEAFLTETEAAATDYKDPLSGKPYTLMKEPSYFFRMSRYHKAITDRIANDPDFVQPESARRELLSRLKQPLEDLSVSRCGFSWGIPVPHDPAHVMYVWCDAMTGYLTGAGFGYYEKQEDMKIWPPNMMVVGKDIAWFHAVVFATMLLSARVELPKVIYAHGFITASDGRKMSKSLGNVVHTKPLLDTFGADSLRYYMTRDSVFGADVRFDVEAMADMHNADLTDTIGNLVHRITTLCVKFCDGCIPAVADKAAPRPFDMVEVTTKTMNYLKKFALQDAIVTVMEAYRDTNKYLTDREPWAANAVETRKDTIRNVLEAVYFLTHLMQAVTPAATAMVFKKLGTPPRHHIGLLSEEYDNLTEGTAVSVGAVLFHKVGNPKKLL